MCFSLFYHRHSRRSLSVFDESVIIAAAATDVSTTTRLQQLQQSTSTTTTATTTTTTTTMNMNSSNVVRQRSNTAPLPVTEATGSDENSSSSTSSTKKSIKDRLEELQKSGEEEWRKRLENRKQVFKGLDPTEKSSSSSSSASATEPHNVGGDKVLSADKEDLQQEMSVEAKVRLRRRSREERPSSLRDRISLLEVSQQGWRQRVAEKDSTQFTVAGKMGVVVVQQQAESTTSTTLDGKSGTSPPSQSPPTSPTSPNSSNSPPFSAIVSPASLASGSAAKARRTPLPKIFKSHTVDLREVQKNESALSTSMSTSVTHHPPVMATVKRSKSMPSKARPELNGLSLSNNDDNNDDADNNSSSETTPTTTTTTGRVVVLPTFADELFQQFFGSTSMTTTTNLASTSGVDVTITSSSLSSSSRIEISEQDFQEFSSSSSTHHQLLSQRKSIRMHNRKHRMSSSRNPLKALATRTDIQQEYTEVNTGVAEQQMKRITVEKIAKSTSNELALSALAGLASKENFKAVELRKSSSFSSPANTRLAPFRDLMLLQVKGRRHVQTRLVEPSSKSVNRGDNFVLVTPAQVYNWIGRYSNVIERSRAAEIATKIQTKRDLGCTSATQVITIDEEKKCGLSHVKKFFQLLGGEESHVRAAGNPKEDEEYENAVIGTNMVYTVSGNALVPLDPYWGMVPKIEMLEPNQVIVFDFGSEMYVWHGKKASQEMRKSGITLARELWESGYDYSECDINPLFPILDDDAVVSRVGEQRPPWAVFARVNQHMETILFREKFLDWPDMSQIIQVKRHESEEKMEVNPSIVLSPYNPKKMLAAEPADPDLILEGSHIGRGVLYHDPVENRRHEITTRGTKVWHVLEFSHRLLPRESWGQFHSGDTYVVRWDYVITVGGRDLSGKISRHSFTGRERCAYFFWQGTDSTISEKGASALMTVELNDEKGPHVRVVQGREPPCFLNLFEGTMVVYAGKREDQEGGKKRRGGSQSSTSSNEESSVSSEEEQRCETVTTVTSCRLFAVRGEVESELHLVEVKVSPASLRSRGSSILVNVTSSRGGIFVWHGALSPLHTRKVATIAAEYLQERRPRELKLDPSLGFLEVAEMEEGKENRQFIDDILGLAVKGTSSSQRSSLPPAIKCTLSVHGSPRLFRMSSISGTFEATEILCSYRTKEVVCPMPFLQSDLYDAQQPALFLLDAGETAFIWLGWWPEATDVDGNDNMATGSAKVRWDVDRRCALETAVLYCKEKFDSGSGSVMIPAYAVNAGLEPPEFVNLFPSWTSREDVAQLNSQDGSTNGQKKPVQDLLEQLTRSRYTLEELRGVDLLPEGVDPSRLESYLDSDTFQNVLGMSKEEFYGLPAWKQNELKKNVQLF